MAPPYAILFMDDLERRFLNTCDIKPKVWWRYIDDIFMIWEHGEDELIKFLDKMNTFHSSIKFTHKHSNKSIDFLDVKLSLENNKISTDLYGKPSDTHQYLHASSCHVYHSKKSIPYSQTLRLNRICSDNKMFDKRCNDLEGWLLERGYCSKMVRNQVLAARKFSRDELLDKVKAPTENVLTLNITYHPRLRGAKNILQKYHMFLAHNTDHEKFFSGIPLVGFRKGKSLKDFLVRAKIQEESLNPGCVKCNAARCQVCGYIEESTEFTDNNETHIYKIRKGPLDCNSKFVVYLLQCKVCSKQNCGSTETKFRIRFNNYKSKFRNYHRMFLEGNLRWEVKIQQAHFHDHFCQEGHHGMGDWSIKLIDQAEDLPGVRLKESFWQHKLDTFAPNGLNERYVQTVTT